MKVFSSLPLGAARRASPSSKILPREVHQGGQVLVAAGSGEDPSGKAGEFCGCGLNKDRTYAVERNFEPATASPQLENLYSTA